MKTEEQHIGLVFKSVVQRREDICVMKENMGVTALMRIYEVVDFKRLLEVTDGKQTKKSLSNHYENVKFAQESEKVTQGFIEVALMLHKSVLSVPEVQATLLKLDQLPKKAIDSVYKIREVAIQCNKQPDLMIWAFGMLADQWLRKDKASDPIPIRQLKESTDQVSLVRLYLWKKQVRDHLWRCMEEHFTAWEVDVKNEIRRLTTSIDVIRAELGYQDDTEQQLAYPKRGSWPPSADHFLTLMETLVFAYQYDECLKNQIRNRRSIEDTLLHREIRTD